MTTECIDRFRFRYNTNENARRRAMVHDVKKKLEREPGVQENIVGYLMCASHDTVPFCKRLYRG